ncbi:hypothetical protein [Actinoplanes regularis]|uniref:hypothetical protein n=1 Tax=Actinoplanes regularis TaxID=52697 RepID=UPI0024A3CDD0|nr:hypothetical protein [Actinoplanes regularis]GLW30433.1 hypothetical protein Areg01_33730 [Actinoplanes regularis]
MTSFADLRAVLRSKTAVEPPAPWCSRPIWIGGVTAVGFAPGSDLLVVLSHNGVGVVDPFTAKTVAREDDEDTYGEHYPVAVTGVGPVAGARIPLAGLWGGGLRTFTPDGWRVAVVAPDWPAEKVALIPPGERDPADDPGAAVIIHDDDPIRAAGFSDSGRVLVVATSMLCLWTRDEVAPRRR